MPKKSVYHLSKQVLLKQVLSLSQEDPTSLKQEVIPIRGAMLVCSHNDLTGKLTPLELYYVLV